MNLLIRWHMAMVMWHLSWLNFWLHWEPEEPDTTGEVVDGWLRQQVRR